MITWWWLVLVVVYGYGLSVLKRAHLPAFRFWWGSIGAFLLLLIVAKPYGIWFMTTLVTRGLAVLGSATGFFQANYQQGFMRILNHHDLIIMFVDYECCGIIETTAFAALVLFFPAYRPEEKFFIVLAGSLWIYLANIIRLFFVAYCVNQWGPSVLFLAHSILGRILFYILTITLYYTTFTRPQILRQLVSGLVRKVEVK